MNLRSAIALAAFAAAFSTSLAGAQAPWPAQPQQPAASPWSQPQPQPQPQTTGPSPWSQEPPPCIKDFVKLRDAAGKHVAAIQAANKRKASPQEACSLFNALYAAQSKMLKFAIDNSASCGIPPELAGNIKKESVKINEIRTKVCEIAAHPPRPAGPTLSDALSAPVPDSSNIKTGRGTYDTLTGTPLGTR